MILLKNHGDTENTEEFTKLRALGVSAVAFLSELKRDLGVSDGANERAGVDRNRPG